MLLKKSKYSIFSAKLYGANHETAKESRQTHTQYRMYLCTTGKNSQICFQAFPHQSLSCKLIEKANEQEIERVSKQASE